MFESIVSSSREVSRPILVLYGGNIKSLVVAVVIGDMLAKESPDELMMMMFVSGSFI